MLRTHKKLTRKELKQDQLVIITAQAVEYLRKGWPKIVSTILGVVIVIALSFFIVRGRERSELNTYDAALKALQNGAPEAIDLLSRYADKYQGSERAAESTMRIANYYYANKDYDNAEKYYRLYLKEYTNDPIFGYNAYNGLGGILEEKGEMAEAGKLYEEFIQKYSSTPFVSIMYLNAGKSYLAAGDTSSAKRNFSKIVDDYADSPEKQEALFYMELIDGVHAGT